MSRRTEVRLAWGLAALTATLLTAGLAGQLLVGETRPVGELAVAALVLAVGTVLTIRRPSNRVGWVYAVSAHAFAWLSALGAITTSGPTTVVTAVAWISSWAWMVAFGLPVTFGLLWFPDGGLASSRWRWVQRSLIATYAVAVSTAAVLPFEVVGAGFPAVENPLALRTLATVLEPVFLAAAIGIVVCALGCIASVAVRLRRAGGVERQQVKWVAAAGVVGVSLFLLGNLVTRLPLVSWDLIYTLAIGLPAAAVTVAILRFRLYEIDRIISRTVSYALLTGLLVAVYLGAVFALQQLLSPITGESELAVAGATLVVAALFGPVRRRVQTAVDRRFNRARYDAQRTVDEFRARLRDEVDLEQLHAELVGAVRGTVEPAEVSVWLRDPRKVRR